MLRLDQEPHNNYPEGYEKKPWCPHTELVQTCASLTGVELTPNTFCTEELENARYSDGTPNYLVSGDFHPKASCARINLELCKQLKLAVQEVQLTPDNIVVEEFSEAETIDAKEAVSDKYFSERERYFKRQEIIDRWRGIIYEKDPHFRQLKSPDDLSEEEIINKVGQLEEDLQKIVCYHNNEAENCPQSPHFRHYVAGSFPAYED